MKGLRAYLKRYRNECFLAPLFKMLEASFELLVPLVISAIIDQGIGGGDGGFIIRMCLILIALGLIGLVCAITAQYFAARAAVGVATGVRPGGSSSTMEMSRSPKRISESVRGMGVADMTSTLGASPFSPSIVRWRTPNRCCSSVTTRPRF